MKWFHNLMKKLLLTGFIMAVVLAGGNNAKADFTFGTPTNLGPTVNSAESEYGPSISSDGLAIYFSSSRSGGYGGFDLYVAERPTVNDDWNPPTNLGSTVNGSAHEVKASISTDGLSLYFSRMPAGWGPCDLWVTTRLTTSHSWGTPVKLGPAVNTSDSESHPYVSEDELSLYFSDFGVFTQPRPGGCGEWDIWLTSRASVNEPWGTPLNLGPPINTAYQEVGPCPFADGRILFFISGRPGGSGEWDIWLSKRPTKNSNWGEPMNLGPIVNSDTSEGEPSISSDGRILYFWSWRDSGNADIWQVSVQPVVDLNGDRKVDSEDMCIMIDNWGTDEPLCDIGPTPFGDGIVDVQDLIILAEHLFEEFPPIQ